ncbi:cell division protein FtsX [Phenylobacterium montanum]|uniref:ABC transporter permease n=1 Tax=Phenylobacterium montanum TaxID=2823693 RepID=A0A975FX54_9CAUL|nr:ABC transporter permease [Caulobacter sp. S6]QUD86920.1 ABC transporter permease [Caulobacter sp. S6]
MSRKPKKRVSRKPAPLLPPRDARDAVLLFVVTVLCLLACVSVLAALSADRAAKGWSGQLTGSATVVVRPKGDETADAAAARAAEALAGVKGVVEAQALEPAKAKALLKPWLGDESLMEDLPIPRLVSVDLDPKAPATADAMNKALTAAGIDASVDDHSAWLKDVIRAGALARLAAGAVAVLLTLTAMAVIVFATFAGLATRADLVSVLHLAGAEDRFIAALFQGRFAGLAFEAGLIGAALAAMIGLVARGLGGGEGLTPVLPLAWTDLIMLLPCPLVAALVAAVAARVTAIGLLKGMA